jgi:hypothetical protein
MAFSIDHLLSSTKHDTLDDNKNTQLDDGDNCFDANSNSSSPEQCMGVVIFELRFFSNAADSALKPTKPMMQKVQVLLWWVQ